MREKSSEICLSQLSESDLHGIPTARILVDSSATSALINIDGQPISPMTYSIHIMLIMATSTTSRRLQRPAFDDVPEHRRRNLAAVKAKHTKPELALRRLLHAMGYRYQLHRRDLPGRPDIVFTRQRLVVEIRGCFWHSDPNPRCKNAVLPKTRADWWAAKIKGNVERDRRNEQLLAEAGWQTIVVWECEVRVNPVAAAERVASLIGHRRGSPRTLDVLGDKN